MRTTTLLTALLTALIVLAGCGTSRINEMSMDAYREGLATQRLQAEQHAASCATNAAGCKDDMCRVAVQLACVVGQPDYRVPMPQLRSPGEEFARGFAPIANLGSTALQLFGIGWISDKQGGTMVDLVNATGGVVTAVGDVVGDVQPNIDNSVTVGRDQIGGDRVDGDKVGGDKRVGDDIRDSCIGDACRNYSPGPIEENNPIDSFNPTNPDPEPEPDP